jgi:hypothetical protein
MLRDKKGARSCGRKLELKTLSQIMLLALSLPMVLLMIAAEDGGVSSNFNRKIYMNLSLGAKSIALFVLSVLFLVLLTVFESSLSGLSLTAEKMISALLLVLPAMIGVVFGILSITRKEPRPWVAILGVLFNALFALFFIFLLSFAG